MSKNVHSCLFLAVVFVALGHRAGAGGREVVIKIYDSARIDSATRDAAIGTAAAIVGETGVPLRWYDCTGDGERRHCDHLRDLRSLVVRLRPALTPGTTPAGGTLSTRQRSDASGLILGLAVVDPAAGSGVLATIFMDRVRSVAQRTPVGVPTLLGRAIAHEIGHLLLATNEHSRNGLMREIWTDAELTVDRPDDWLFAPADRVALQKGATLRLKPDSTYVESARGVRLHAD